MYVRGWIGIGYRCAHFFFVGTLLQVVILDGVGDNLMMRGGAMGKTVPRKNGQFFFLMFVIFLLLWIASISFFSKISQNSARI